MSEEIAISEMYVHLELDELKEKFVWAKDEFTLAKFVSMINSDRSKLRILLDSIPMDLLFQYTQKKFNTVIHARRKNDFIKSFLEFNLTSDDILELINLYQAFEKRPPAALTFYFVKRPKDMTSNDLLERFKKLPNSYQLKEWRDIGKRYGVCFSIKSVDVELLENLKYRFDSGAKKTFYAIYNPSKDWIGVSSSKVSDLTHIILYLRNHLKVRFAPFNFGKQRTTLPDQIKRDFWLRFFVNLDNTEVFSDPRVNLTFFTDPTDRSIKKYSITSYREVRMENPEFQRSIKEDILKGLWIEGIRGSILFDKEIKLNVYIRDFKKRTTFSIMKRPTKISLEKEIWILAKLFEFFSEFVSEYQEKVPYHPTIEDFY